MREFFITATDTDIGKTFISIGLCLFFENKKKTVNYYKPFQSGAFKKDGKFLAPDLEELKKYSSIPSYYSYLLEGETSPYLASKLTNTKIELSKIKKDYKKIISNAEYTIIEGAGGLYCPVFDGVLFSDIINLLSKESSLETIVVTTPKLGHLNHTLMTLECLKLNNIKVKGLIINRIEKKETQSEKNFIKELKAFSDVKILARIPKIENPGKEAILEAFKDINLED